jgi:hypothetical protein
MSTPYKHSWARPSSFSTTEDSLRKHNAALLAKGLLQDDNGRRLVLLDPVAAERKLKARTAEHAEA